MDNYTVYPARLYILGIILLKTLNKPHAVYFTNRNSGFDLYINI